MLWLVQALLAAGLAEAQSVCTNTLQHYNPPSLPMASTTVHTQKSRRCYLIALVSFLPSSHSSTYCNSFLHHELKLTSTKVPQHDKPRFKQPLEQRREPAILPVSVRQTSFLQLNRMLTLQMGRGYRRLGRCL
jgi:hypothetical protein